MEMLGPRNVTFRLEIRQNRLESAENPTESGLFTEYRWNVFEQRRQRLRATNDAFVRRTLNRLKSVF